jgi:hypothetical protein
MPLDAAFPAALWTLAQSCATRPEVLLLVWWAESGLDPASKNQIGCIGLNQSCPRPYGPGFPTSDPETYRRWPASQQLTWVGPQLEAACALHGGPFESAARYWQANILPKSLETAHAPDDTIAARAGPYAAAYRSNRGLDFTGDGRITLNDMGDVMARQLAAGRAGGAHHVQRIIDDVYRARPADARWNTPLALWDAVYETGSVRHVPEPGAAPMQARAGGEAGTGIAVVFLAGLAFVSAARRRRWAS